MKRKQRIPRSPPLPKRHSSSEKLVILEGIVTSIDASGNPNVSPMGPRIDANFNSFVLRPYQTSQTYQNLKQHGEGVFHITDDVDMLARAAVRQLDPLPTMKPAADVRGYILPGACRWYAFRVEKLEDDAPRTTISCHIVASGRLRDFLGFNRAKHAVVEAAILATRLEFLPRDEILQQMKRLAIIVNKTAGDQERQAFDFLEAYINNR